MANIDKIKKTLISIQRDIRVNASRLKVDDERILIDKKMRELGARRLGSGAFGAVYGWKGFAIKRIYTRENMAYLSYARHCQRDQSKLGPRVHHIIGAGRHTLVIMETLKRNNDAAMKFAKAFKKMMHNGVDENVWESAIIACGRRTTCVEKHLEAIRTIKNKHRRSGWDMHSGNLMFRCERGALRMVFTDPITW